MNIKLNDKGFTLVEVMVVLLITGVMMIFVFRFIFDQINGYQRQQLITDTQQNLRITMDQITRDIRMAGNGIPNVPIYTGDTPNTAGGFITASGTRLPVGVVYPIIIIKGGHSPSGYVLYATPSHGGTGTVNTSVNDSIILIYKDPERTNADMTTLQLDMASNTSEIVVPKSSVDTVNGGTAPNGTGFATNIPFIITDINGRKADMFMVTSATASGTTDCILNVTAGGVYDQYNKISTTNTHWGHYANFTAASAADGVTGYTAGAKIFAVEVIRYDWSDDDAGAHVPITRIKNADTNRNTADTIGEYFGDKHRWGAFQAAPETVNAMKIEWAAPSNASSSFNRYMPSNPYAIGTIRVTLTAHTAVNENVINSTNTAWFRTRTLSQDVQPRNYTVW